MIHGWNDRILWVDLAKNKIEENSVGKRVYENFIGGKGLGTYLLYKNLRAGIDPLGPENILIFLTGPLQGLPAPNVGRWAMVTKSPLSGYIIDSHCGGALGREIKRAGYDAVCVTGEADEPVYLKIDDDSVTIESASHLWGKGVHETTSELHDEGNSVYTIGPAGENLSRIATGCCDIAHQTGRGGTGAVMGSKNLKAVVARGTKSMDAADIDTIREINRQVANTWKEKKNALFKKYGTPFLVEVSNNMGTFPTRNYQTGFFDDYEGITPETMVEKWGLGAHNSCPHCVMRCTHAFKTEDPDDPGREVESCIEYESLGLLGGNTGISDPQAVLKLNYMCDELGLDTISAGSTIGFVMELFEEGVLTEEDYNFKTSFGDYGLAVWLLRMMAHREGIGEIFADGVRKAAERIGKGSEKFAVHVKGLELPAWDPRGKKGLGLSYATANVGASHLRGWPQTNEIPNASALDVVESMIDARDQKILTDSLVVCHFTYHIPLTHETKIKLLNAATGLEFDEKSAKLFARRVDTLGRMFNIREGLTRKDDRLPPRLWEPHTSGPTEGMRSFISKEDFERSLDKYYELRGYDKNGVPDKETLDLLGLSSIV